MRAVDPIACLRIEDVEITLGGEDFIVEGHCAADWIAMVLGGNLYSILPAWIDHQDDARVFIEMLIDGEVSEQEAADVIMEIMTVAAGRASWWVCNLIAMANSDNSAWATLHGRLMLGGVHADQVSLGAWIDALYACMVDNMDSDNRLKFDTAIEAPPPGTAIDEVEEGQAFLDLMNSGMGM